MPFRAKGFRGRPPSGGGDSGPGVTQYATVAELIAASQDELAEGYYEVTTVPEYHPQYPRIITYWDGAAFEPQISTGFESRPSLANERFVWDAIEQQWRQKLAVDTRVTHLRNLVGQDALTTRITGVTNIANASKVTDSLWESRIPDASALQIFADGSDVTAASDVTLIYAGRFLLKTTAETSAVGWGVGTAVNNQFLGAFSHVSAENRWVAVIFGAGTLPGPLARLSEGDVVLLSYSHSGPSVTMWVNGTKYGPSNLGALSLTVGRILALNSLNNGRFGNFDNGFASAANTTLDDTAAAAWTAWLQNRYEIPEL